MEYAINNAIEPEDQDTERWRDYLVANCLSWAHEISQELAAKLFF